MGTFDRYLAGQLLTYFGFFSLVLVAVYWVNRAIGLFDRLIEGGAGLGLFLEFTALSLPNVIFIVLPVSALVAVLYGINRMSADSEMVVAQTTGLGPWHLARPVAIFGLIVALMVTVLAHLLVPASRTALAERGAALSQDVTARFLKEGEFLHPGDGVTVYVREITEAGELLGLFLQDRRHGETRTSYTAERALLVRGDAGTRLVMFDGMAQTLTVADRRIVTVSFEDFAYDLAGLTEGAGDRRRDPRELPTLALLRGDAAAQAATGEGPAVLVSEGHIRIVEAIFAFSVPLLALGCLLQGGYSRLGLWRQIMVAVLLAITLKMLVNAAENAARDDGALWPLLYVPPGLGLGLSAALLWRAAVGRRPFARGLPA
ncbi:LPS export ABC transporter permease LptF [Jannaschia seohaensis]|uniref:Lipopolysaccharide export system permease protein n=1 Tax=Jannaschia seohaensis TaxID=475081 RepID=A0A2Y9AA71_9RHOB|nr:LPS export ABC transporter permease LptF [Jannaschia seohaensis]PWJ21054.1 lipopolysaccharide export system permease protein [Jannaschia seohaensis]SSA41464.1 lipopolysaccharide export system permease protein [Jannaschia seohaensis]